MVLEYLISSATRRQLLFALWRDDKWGTVSHLAREAGCAQANAYHELRAMVRADLATQSQEGGATVYRANVNLTEAASLRALVGAPPLRTKKPRWRTETDDRERDVRRWLRDLGAPLVVEGDANEPSPPVEQVLAEGTRLAHTDATVARVLPYCLWLKREEFAFDRLERAARHLREKHALGFLLAVAGAVSGDRRLSRQANRLRDRRVRAPRDFFPASSSGYARKLAEKQTPALARTWHYRMNLPLRDFTSVFEKFSGHANVSR